MGNAPASESGKYEPISEVFKLRCASCKKTPQELPDVVALAVEDGMHPDRWVMTEEGTLDPATGAFLCTPCYISHRMPSNPRGWKTTQENLAAIGIGVVPTDTSEVK